MSPHDARTQKINDLVDRINNISQRRKRCLDEMWILEEEARKLRIELTRLLREAGYPVVEYKPKPKDSVDHE